MSSAPCALERGKGASTPQDIHYPQNVGQYEPGWRAGHESYVSLTGTSLGSCTGPSDDTILGGHTLLPYSTWTDMPGAHEELPINCVNWFEAYAFCIWDGGFLPSSAELEYTSAADCQQREYPWGSTDPGTMNQYAIYHCFFPDPMKNCQGVANIAPVGSAALGAALWLYLRDRCPLRQLQLTTTRGA